MTQNELMEMLGNFIRFMEDNNIPHKWVEGDDGRSDLWAPLGPLLRRCKYRQPTEADANPFERAGVQKILIAGRVQASIRLFAFCCYYAPSCRVQQVQDLGVAVVNAFLVDPHKADSVAGAPEPTDPMQVLDQEERREALIEERNRMEPGFGNLLSLPSTRFVGLGDGRTAFATQDLDFTSVEGSVTSFLKLHPEWRDDVTYTEDGRQAMTFQLALAISLLMKELGLYISPESDAFRHALVEQIIQDGGYFGPLSQKEGWNHAKLS